MKKGGPNIDISGLLTQVEREACKASLFEFVKSFWSVIIPEDPVFNWHIPYLCEELEKLSHYIVNRLPKPYDIIINIPPGTTKSTIVTIMFPAWLWTQDPTLRIISNSYSADLSIEHATKSRDIINSDKYRRLFPEVQIRRDKSGKGNYENTKTGARYTTSTGGTITGKHAHVIINDDPLNPSQAESDVLRAAANEHTKTLASRKVDKKNTPTITIMQRLHEDDVTGYLLAKKGDAIRHLNLPAELSDRVLPPEVRKRYINGLLDPVRLDLNTLREAKTDLGSRAYSGQYEQDPVAAGGNIVKRDWFPTISRYDFERLRTYEPIIFWADTAYTDNAKDNDPTGLLAACKIGAYIYILKVKKVYLSFPDLISFLPNWLLENGYNDESSFRVEPKANGISVIQTLKRTGLNVVETPSPRDSKKVRFNAVAPTIEAGRVFLVMDNWNEDYLDEVTGFPAKTHDELVDLTSYCVDYYNNTDGGPQTDLADYFN